MKTKTGWPKIVRVGNARVTVYKRSGNAGFRLRYFDETGKEVFESASNETKALQTAQRKAELLSMFGARVAEVTPDAVAEYVRARDILKPHGLTVETVAARLDNWLKTYSAIEAIDRALAGAPVTAHTKVNSPVVASAVTEFLAFKSQAGVGELHHRDMKSRLNTFAEKFQCPVHTITTLAVQQWLDGLKTSQPNYQHYRRILSVFFGWCVKRAGYHSENVVLKTELKGGKVQAKNGGGNGHDHVEDVLIYSPEEMDKLMKAAVECQTVPLFALRAFCGGMRMTEFARLQWAAVDFEAGFVKLSASRAKTGNRRLAPLTTNCEKWLKPLARKTGFVWTDRINEEKKDKSFPQILDAIGRAMRKTFEKAGVKQNGNALRHSFCTYRLALLKDAAAVASEAGDSADIIHTHYKALSLPDGRLVTEELAKQYFQV